MAKVILYEDENFCGKSLELTEGCPNLEKHGFNDIVSSIEVKTGEWMIYDDEGYNGPSYKLTPGKYPNPKTWGGVDDELSSVKPA